MMYRQAAPSPSFACNIGDCTLDRRDILTGPHDDQLLRCLAGDGYTTQ
ncbi:MAG: hypothetical protein IJJ45_07010 [Clostridia bacterium]|nr:hypothetical protein [Clostridia bacterium]